MSVGIHISENLCTQHVEAAQTYATSFEVTKASPVHQASNDIHSHKRPPIQHIDLSISGRNVVHLVNSEARHLLDSIMPIFQQRFPAHWSRKHAATNRVVFSVCEGEHGSPRPRPSQLVVPVTLHKVCADAMDVVETLDVTDGELVWSNADMRAVLLVQRIDIFRAAACHDCDRKW